SMEWPEMPASDGSNGVFKTASAISTCVCAAIGAATMAALAVSRDLCKDHPNPRESPALQDFSVLGSQKTGGN
ncbi:MAG: hypothetical protein NWR12_05455, partial [Haliea sp.]|nr:hypothetical protein [Haliea sp.]